MAVNYFCTLHKITLSKKDIEKWSRALLAEYKNRYDLSIHIIGDKKMSSLNSKYRAKKGPTDVLSFPTGNTKEIKSVNDKQDIGDIFICWPVLKKQAKEYQVSEKQEFLRLMIHGFLHLIGYTHYKSEDSDKMFSRQKKLVNKLAKL